MCIVMRKIVILPRIRQEKNLKNGQPMCKKVAKVLVVLMLMFSTWPLHAQVFIQDEEFEGRGRTGYEDFGLVVPYQGGDQDQYVPLGDGVLALTLLGGAYLMKKLRKKEEAK